MKLVLKEDNLYILRLDKNEELIKSLIGFCEAENINSGIFNAIGSACEITLSYFNLKTRQYEDRIIKENVEIVSITGNISILNRKLAIHAHGVCSKNDFSTIGGHIKQLTVSATAEICIKKTEAYLERKYDEVSGLNLLDKE